MGQDNKKQGAEDRSTDSEDSQPVVDQEGGSGILSISRRQLLGSTAGVAGAVGIRAEPAVAAKKGQMLEISSLQLDRQPAIVTPHTTDFTEAPKDTTSILGAPMSLTGLVEIRQSNQNPISASRVRLHWEIENKSGDLINQYNTEIFGPKGNLPPGTSTHRKQIRGGLDPGNYKIRVELQFDTKGALSDNYIIADRAVTNFSVASIDNTPVVEIPTKDTDNNNQSKSYIGKVSQLSLEEKDPVVKFIYNTLNILLARYAGDTLPSFGVDKEEANEMLAGTAQARLQHHSNGKISLLWENRGVSNDTGGQASIWYDRAVVTARIPDSVKVSNAVNADYVIHDGDSNTHIITWIINRVDKGIRPKPAIPFTFDYENPTGFHRFELVNSDDATQKIQIEYSVSLELGPMRQAPPLENIFGYYKGSLSGIDSIYDYEFWQKTPKKAHWGSIGLTKRTDTIKVPSNSGSGGGSETSELTVNVVHPEHGKLTSGPVVTVYRDGEQYKQKSGSPTFTLENGVEYRVRTTNEYENKERTVTLTGDKEITFEVGQKEPLNTSIVSTNNTVSKDEKLEVTVKVENTTSETVDTSLALFTRYGGGKKKEDTQKNITLTGDETRDVTLTTGPFKEPGDISAHVVILHGPNQRTTVPWAEPKQAKLSVDELYPNAEEPSEPAKVTVLRDGEEVARKKQPPYVFQLESGVEYTVRVESEVGTAEKTTRLPENGTQLPISIDDSSGNGGGNEPKKAKLHTDVVYPDGDRPSEPATVTVLRDGEEVASKKAGQVFTLEDGVKYTVRAESSVGSTEKSITLRGESKIVLGIEGSNGGGSKNPGELKPSIVKTNGPISQGDTVKVTASIENTGDTELSDTVTLYVGVVGGPDRVQYDERNVTVAGGSSKTVTLSYTSDSSSSRDIVAQVSVDGSSDKTTIKKAES